MIVGPAQTSTVLEPRHIASAVRLQTIAIAVGAILVFLFALRFWVHDALPYFMDYSQESYRRYWPVRKELLFHVVGGTVALLAGPWQLWSGLRRRFLRLHKVLGYAYITGIVVSAASSFSLAFHSKPDFGLSLFILALIWLATIAMAFTAIRNRRIDVHQEWMIRSYILTFSFASYRYLVKLPLFAGLGQGRAATVLWISWVVPMMLFELYTQWDRVKPRRHAAPAPRSREFV